jgi:hypothetical protein
MMICRTLRRVQRNYVDFDVNNPEHLEAFRLLCLGNDDGLGIHTKQHPSIRFNLEENFQDVRTMMFHKVGQAYLASKSV